MVDVLPPGTIVGGDFVVVGSLDEGGMGAVYRVEQRSTGKPRALKVMHREIAADPGLTKRFEQEARVGSRIKSDHVVDVVAAGVDATLRLPYLVMELLDGEDLRHRVETRGALPRDEVRQLFEQICHALAAAHAAGIVHRDIKPENVFIARAQRAGAGALDVKVLDFGIAKVAAEAGTRATRGAVGSPLWMAPEQTQPGPVTPAADVWALGLLAYELLTGRPFWRAANDEAGTSAQLLREIVLDPIPPGSVRAREQGSEARLPQSFDAWFARCVARDPSARYGDGGAAWRAMKRMFDGTPVGEELAATSAAQVVVVPSAPPLSPGSPVPSMLTGSPSPYIAPHRPNVPPETPIASTRNPTPMTPPAAPPVAASKTPFVIGGAIAIAGMAIGVGLSRRGGEPVTTTAPMLVAPPASSAPAPAPAPAPEPARSEAPIASASASAPPIVAVRSDPASAPPALSVVATKPIASASAAPLPKRTVGGGFGDPVDRNGAVLWKVQGRQVRLFTKLVSNESNVADPVVKKAVEWSSWMYLRCYERAFSGAKDMPEGIVTVSFEIIDQLPRHAKVDASTFESATMADCVKNTLLGQTINAAGPDGKGKATHAFRFVPVE